MSQIAMLSILCRAVVALGCLVIGKEWVYPWVCGMTSSGNSPSLPLDVA